MSRGPEQAPRTQEAPSGGPPKPPKKTARGLEDGGGDSGANVAERIISEYELRLLNPKLGAADRRQLQKCLDDLRAQRQNGG
jgi:hypothetical protein